MTYDFDWLAVGIAKMENDWHPLDTNEWDYVQAQQKKNVTKTMKLYNNLINHVGFRSSPTLHKYSEIEYPNKKQLKTRYGN